MKHQQGASYIAILMAVIGFAFIAKVAVTIWGPYWDDRVLDTQIEELLKASPKNIDPNKFNSQMSHRLSMNNIYEMKFDEVAKVTNVNGIQVHKDYEIRKNFMMNIDLLMKFEKQFDQNTVKAQ
jgi:hypothetical protein